MATLLGRIKQLLTAGSKVDRLGLNPELLLPPGWSEEQLFGLVSSVRVEDGPEDEMRAYATQDFRRFVYTWGLASQLSGRCLELGANPYFTTMLLEKFSDLELELANYFGESCEPQGTQSLVYREPGESHFRTSKFGFSQFNVESDVFPYTDQSFDVVIFAEIIEHLLNDPCHVIREIHRVLRPRGALILTTPNVARLENVSRLIAGANIYDPYSGYGPYGRHNREYNQHELVELLTYEGFDVDVSFTADVHDNIAANYFDINKVCDLVAWRAGCLGQYIFIRARKTREAKMGKRPAWLYRSYPPEELE